MLEHIFHSCEAYDTTHPFGDRLLSSRMKDQYYTTGVLPGFMGINWSPVSGLPDGVVLLMEQPLADAPGTTPCLDAHTQLQADITALAARVTALEGKHGL